jgi:hypothetical protein
VKNLFQNSPFKCNPQRYHVEREGTSWINAMTAEVGLCTLNQVDP